MPGKKARFLDVGARVRALRERVPGLTGQQVADRSGRLTRTEIVDFENGRSQCSTSRIVRGYAAAFGTSTNDMDDYIQGLITLEELDTRTATRMHGFSGDATDPRYPERGRALHIPLAKLLPPPVIEVLMTERHAGTAQRSAVWWVERAVQLTRDFEDGAGKFAPDED